VPNEQNAILWNYQPPSGDSSAAQSSALFVRECRKLVFAQLDAGHWFFVRAQQRHAYIAAVDSCTGTHSDAISLVQSFIEHLHAQNACKRGLTVQTQRTEDWRSASLQPPVTPRQPDAVSCGIYMLIGLWCCMSGAQLSQCLDSKPVNYWRDVITLCLYRGGLGAFALPALP
jgi:hypothetical protein